MKETGYTKGFWTISPTEKGQEIPGTENIIQEILEFQLIDNKNNDNTTDNLIK